MFSARKIQNKNKIDYINKTFSPYAWVEFGDNHLRSGIIWNEAYACDKNLRLIRRPLHYNAIYNYLAEDTTGKPAYFLVIDLNKFVLPASSNKPTHVLADKIKTEDQIEILSKAFTIILGTSVKCIESSPQIILKSNAIPHTTSGRCTHADIALGQKILNYLNEISVNVSLKYNDIKECDNVVSAYTIYEGQCASACYEITIENISGLFNALDKLAMETSEICGRYMPSDDEMKMKHQLAILLNDFRLKLVSPPLTQQSPQLETSTDTPSDEKKSFSDLKSQPTKSIDDLKLRIMISHLLGSQMQIRLSTRPFS